MAGPVPATLRRFGLTSALYLKNWLNVDSDSESSISLAGVVGGILALIAFVGFGFGFGVPLLISALGLGSEVELSLENTLGEESEYEVSLPPTDGAIELVFEPSDQIEEVRNASMTDAVGLYRVSDCARGCSIQIAVGQGFESGTLRIKYLEGDSEFLDDIELVELG